MGKSKVMNSKEENIEYSPFDFRTGSVRENPSSPTRRFFLLFFRFLAIETGWYLVLASDTRVLKLDSLVTQRSMKLVGRH